MIKNWRKKNIKYLYNINVVYDSIYYQKIYDDILSGAIEVSTEYLSFRGFDIDQQLRGSRRIIEKNYIYLHAYI